MDDSLHTLTVIMQRPFKFFSGGVSLSMAPKTETTPLRPSRSNALGQVAETDKYIT